jgi:cytohesin
MDIIMSLLALAWLILVARHMYRAFTDSGGAAARRAAGEIPLHRAAQAANVQLARRLLEQRTDVNARDGDGVTPLLCASTPSMARLLLEHGADPRAADASGHTALHWATDAATAQLLLDRGAEVNLRSADDETPLDAAAMSGLDELVELLIERGAVIAGNENAVTALHRAGSARTAQLLLDHGARVNAPDNFRDTPLHWACARGLRQVAECLLANGAELDAVNHAGQTPLYRAIEASSVEVTKLLLARHAQVMARDNRGATPLHHAARWCDAEAGPIGGLGGYLMSGQPHRDRARIAALLLDGGAEPDAADDDRMTPLHFAARDGFVEVAELLIAKGADVNARDRAGRTALYYAAQPQELATEVSRFQKSIRLMSAVIGRHGGTN